MTGTTHTTDPAADPIASALALQAALAQLALMWPFPLAVTDDDDADPREEVRAQSGAV